MTHRVQRQSNTKHNSRGILKGTPLTPKCFAPRLNPFRFFADDNKANSSRGSTASTTVSCNHHHSLNTVFTRATPPSILTATTTELSRNKRRSVPLNKKILHWPESRIAMFISSFLLPLLTVTTLVSAAGHGHGVRRHHAKLANRGNATEVEEGALTKRGPSFSGVATWYDSELLWSQVTQSRR